jgi:hypothetical protein
MIRSSLATLSVLAVLGCAGRGSQVQGEPAGPLRAVLRSVTAPVSGEAFVTPGTRPESFNVVLRIMGSEAGQQHPWHVHAGNCEAPGDVVGSVISYRPMAIRGDGQYNLEVTIDGHLQRGRAYHVDVHASPTQPDRIVACGNLLPEG